MRLTLKLDGNTYWLDMKDQWTRKDMRVYRDALAQDEIAERERGDGEPVDLAVLGLLERWGGECFFVDVNGNEYHHVSELNSNVLDDMDAPIAEFVIFAPFRARNERASLGEVSGGRH